MGLFAVGAAVLGGILSLQASKKAGKEGKKAAEEQKAEKLRVAKIQGNELVNESRDTANLLRANARVARAAVGVRAAASGITVGSGSVKAVQDAIIFKASADALIGIATAKKVAANELLNAETGGASLIAGAKANANALKSNTQAQVFGTVLNATANAFSQGSFDNFLNPSR